ncbi:methylated-DNA--[bacterium]|nr:methylated-DNA--[protein]-cysteine S-methyltransferase [bacterium]
MEYVFSTQIGNLKIKTEEGEIVSLSLVSEKISDFKSSEKLVQSAIKELDEYFKGKRKTFSLPLNPKGTPFQKRVWEELRKIPYGKTVSYQDIALRLGNKNLTRAVGGANNKNPIIILIPCHRVIGKNGTLTGFACGVDIKEKLLKLEKGYSLSFGRGLG